MADERSLDRLLSAVSTSDISPAVFAAEYQTIITCWSLAGGKRRVGISACNSYDTSEYSAALLYTVLLCGNGHTTRCGIGDLAIPLQPIQNLGYFQQGALVVCRQGAEVLDYTVTLWAYRLTRLRNRT